MGEDVKDDHVTGIWIEPLQGHDVMPDQLCCPGLLPGLRQHFPNGPRLAGQMVIRLHLPDQVHALLVREGRSFTKRLSAVTFISRSCV